MRKGYEWVVFRVTDLYIRTGHYFTTSRMLNDILEEVSNEGTN